MLGSDGGNDRGRDRVFAAKDDRKFSAVDQLRGDAADLGHHLVHGGEGKLHLRQREDPDPVHVGVRLLVP